MKLNKELVKGSTAMLVLSVLEKQDMYGYQIIKTVALLSDDVFSLNEGTLYPILHALEKNEFVLTDGSRIPISRSYREEARRQFFQRFQSVPSI